MKESNRCNIAFWLLLLAILTPLSRCQAEENARPNVVVFLVDDMGWQETSVPFHTEVTELNRRYQTPNMERMAVQGMKFTQAYASAVCSPTRVSLLSGMNVARHRVTNWTLRKDRSPDQASKFIMPPKWNFNGVTTEADVNGTTRITPLPALLKATGYRTIHVGKAHFGAKGMAGEDPQHFGFDVNIAGHAAGGPGSYWGEKNFSAAWRNEDRIWDVPGLEKYHGQDVYLTEALTREAIKAMETAVKDGEPFYLYLSHYAVHAPWEKDNRFYQKYIDEGLKPFEATLASMIEGMDKSLGDVLDALKTLGVEKNAVVLFLSDNGSPSQCPPNVPLRGHKITPYEGGIRVPMLALWPDVIKANSVNTNPVVVEDFFPTILELAGVVNPETSQTVDGISFVPLLKGDGNRVSDRPFVWHFPHQYSGTPFSAVRQNSWKLIYHHNTRKHELFNLAEDISEANDLAPSEVDKVNELSKVLGERLRAMDAQMPIDKTTGQPVEWPDETNEERKSSQAVDVYLLGGQSNMQGLGKVAEIPSEIPKEIPNTFFWAGGKFEPLVLGKTKISSRLTEFGPEVGFALNIASAQRPVYLIKYYASGMPLHHGWNGGNWVGGEPAAGRRNFYPGEQADDTNTGTLYIEMRDQFKAGMKDLSEQGFEPTIRGFVWMQGEQDSKQEVSATNYASSLKRLRLRLIEDMKTAPDLPFVFGQVLPHEPPLERFTYRKEIREQMAACDPSSNKPEAMMNTKMVSTDGYSLLPDTVHYDTAGQLRLGEALASALKQMVSAEITKVNQRIPALPQVKVPESSLCKALQWKGVAIEEKDYCIWGASPIVVDGEYHLFAARWPESNVDPAWRKSSEIAHYTAEKPEGPFAFRQVVLQGTGTSGDWDAYAPHNPEIKRIGQTFVLCYIANSDFHQPPHPLNQQIGMMVADDINGPWKKVGENGLVLSPSNDPEHFSYGKQVVNPTLIQVGTKYHLYFKTGGKIRGTTVYGLAISDQLTGPYRMRNEPLTNDGVTIEDATVFEWDEKICLLTTDNHGHITGVTGGGALWVSDDGIRFKPEWTQLGYQTIAHYYSAYDPQRVTKVYGTAGKFERPKVLCIENRPAWLYAPSGWNVTGGKRTVCHVLKIDLELTDSPTSALPP